MTSFRKTYILNAFLAHSPFSSTFTAPEIQELVNEADSHIKKLPLSVYFVFNLGSLAFTLFPLLAKLPYFSRIEILLSRFVRTILLLYITGKIPK